MGDELEVERVERAVFFSKPASLVNKLKIRLEARYLWRKHDPISLSEDDNLSFTSFKR